MSDVATKKYLDKIRALVPLSGTVVAGTSLVGANIPKACVDNLAEAQEATSLMNFTVRRLEQRLKDAVCEVDEYRRAIVSLESKIKQLEEAGDKMASAWDKEWLTEADIEAIIDDWHGAKEAKP